MSKLPSKHLCAHRGYHNATNDSDPERPLENTLPAYKMSFAALEFAECDVQCTRDQAVVLAHDITLARVAELSPIPTGTSTPWPDGALALFEPVAAWYALPPSKRQSIQKRIPPEQTEAFQNMLEVAPLLHQAGTIAPDKIEEWVNSHDLSESASSLLSSLALVERATLQAQRAEQRFDNIVLLHYLAHRAVADLTLTQVQQVPLKGGERVPLLSQVLELVAQHPSGNRHLVIEVKPGSPEVVEPLCEMLSNLNLHNNATIMSFDLDVIQAVAQNVGSASDRADKSYRCLWLACTQNWDADAHGFIYAQITEDPASLGEVIKTIQDSSLNGIYLEYDETIVTQDTFKKLKGLGLFVGIWSSNKEHDCKTVANKLIAQGADLINTDEAILLPKSLSEG